MNSRFTIGNSYPYGVSFCEAGLQFCFACSNVKNVTLKIFGLKDKLLCTIDMLKYKVCGNVYSVVVSNLDYKTITYEYVADGKLLLDPYAKCFRKSHAYGDFKDKIKPDRARVYIDAYDWEGDVTLKTPYSESIGYLLHVRGFTKHSSSKVKHKGTFMGLIEKIPYLKELGVTQVELLPAYEFDECDCVRDYRAVPDSTDSSKDAVIKRINFWGFKVGNYFVPKSTYAYSDDPVMEFKTMVKELHRNGIEVVMQFYFPSEVPGTLIGNCLQFWVNDYHIDGFHLLGENMPVAMLATDPILTDTKLYCDRYDRAAIFSERNEFINNFSAVFNDEYMNEIRRFLKSDEDMIQKFLYRQRFNGGQVYNINYITNYQGFTLNDLVSYDYKHNDDNGEGNKDGNSYNFSWNCGVEGPTRKSSILKLRNKQIKNALCMLLLSQSMPMLLAGDEFLNSQSGNNNPYCQDNDISWINWKQNKLSNEIYDFTRMLIEFRKSHPILHLSSEVRLMDYKTNGYPDLSYHAENAWYPKLDTHIRHIGLMFCGKYAKCSNGKEDSFIYIAVNMHWEEHDFALPKLPAKIKWNYAFDTESDLRDSFIEQLSDCESDIISVPSRSILVLEGC